MAKNIFPGVEDLTHAKAGTKQSFPLGAGVTKILIAEDEPTQRRLLEGLLERWGYEIITAESGDVARSVLESENRPQLAILDWMMPGADGLQLCRELRQQSERPYVYIILVSSKDRQQDLVEALEAGADDFMTKPFDPVELRCRLHTGLRIIHLQQQLIRASKHDSLTELLNRGAIMTILEQELIRLGRQGGSLSVIMADIDHFKKINDTVGHLAGDAVLKEIARQVSSSVRPYDAVGRYGGEEFLIVLPGCDFQNARIRAEEVRLLVECRKVPPGSVPVTLSLGVGATATPVDPKELLRRADEALYRAKSNGRNRVEVDSELEA